MTFMLVGRLSMLRRAATMKNALTEETVRGTTVWNYLTVARVVGKARGQVRNVEAG